MEFRLLGPLQASEAGEVIPLGGPKQRTVLTHLLLRPNQIVPADRLIDEVWGIDAPDAVRSSLHSYVSHLRKALGSERLEGKPAGYVLHVDPAEIDVLRFEDLVAQAREVASADPGAAVRWYSDALSLWQGNVLDDLAQQPSLRPEIARLEALRMAVVEEKIAAELDLGRHAALVPELETLTARNPLSERLWAHLMIALYRSGRQADALAAFRKARTILDEELGILPSPELQRLQERVLRQEPGLDVAGTPLRGYRVREQLGAGAFGVVHRAYQPQINREVAIKAVHPDLANDAEFIRRFEVEAQIIARLEHPHIVPLYDYWREPDGAFLVMRLLRGGSLRELLDSGAVETDVAVRVVEQVSRALAIAHRQGIVHRDVKPANILFDEERNAYLGDFGIAKDIALSHELAQGRTSRSLSFYLAPEEARGEPVTPRTDIYSLGLVAYEMLSGRRPAAATDATGALPPVVAGGAPTPVDDVLRRATASDPQARFDTTADMSAALRDALAIGPAKTVSAPVRNPYRGLRPFQEADAANFFGREALVQRLLTRLNVDGPASRFVTVVGASGGGKSSSVRAGLLPAIRAGGVRGSDRWFVVDMVPSRNPFAELLGALRRLAARPLPPNLADRVLHGAPDCIVTTAQWILGDDATELLLLVDQLEELFTLVEDEAVRSKFAAALATAARDPRSRVRVVATLRADFLDRPLAYPVIADLVAAGSELVAPLTAEEIERAVVEPAAAVGVTVEAGLLAKIVAEVTDQPGALPLLQYAMTEMFDHRTGAVLDLQTYHAVGGVTGALGRRAEEIYDSLRPAGRDAARQLFLRLVVPGEGGHDTRRRVERAELVALLGQPELMERTIDVFGEARLLSFDRDPETRAPTVEVAHEALLREWDRVRDLIDDFREDLRTHRWLHAAAREWSNAGRDASFLVGGARLSLLETWQRRSGLATTPDEQAFIAESAAERDRQAALAAERDERERALERRSYRRLRALVAVLGAAALVAGGLTVYAVDQQRDAQAQGREAQEQARVARARELAAAAVANLEVDAERSMLLAIEAIETTRSHGAGVLPEAEEALHRAVAASRVVATVPGLGGRLDWSPDGRLFVTEGPEGSGLIDIRDAATGERVRAWPGHDVDINDVVFSPDGTQLASAGDDGALRIWDVASGDKVAEVNGNRQVLAPAFSADGRRVVAAWPEDSNVTQFSDPGTGMVRLLDIRSGRLVNEFGPYQPGEGAFATALSPHGRHVAVALGDESAVRIIDTASGELVTSLEGHVAPVADIDWSPDGHWIATSGTDGSARIWTGRTYRPRFDLRGHTANLVDGDWGPASNRLVTASQDGTAKVWSITDDGTQELLTLSAHDTSGGLAGVAFSPDGDRVMTGDALISSVRVWDVTAAADPEWATFPADPEALPAGVAFGEDVIITSPKDGILAVRNSKTYEQQGTIDPKFIRAFDIEIDPKREFVAVAGDGGYGVWDLATGKEALRVPTGGFGDVAWTSDGEFLAAVYQYDYSAVHIHNRAGERVTTIKYGLDSEPMAVQFSPDNALLAIAWWQGDLVRTAVPRIELWDWRQSKKVTTIDQHANTAAFDPAGKTLVGSGENGVASVWDVQSGKLLRSLRGHAGPIGDAVFSPDGRRIATAGYDGTVRLWDARSSLPSVVLRGHSAPVSKVRFSPDGTKLVSTAGDGTARVWAVDVDDLIRLADTKLTRTLTDEECRQFLQINGCAETG